jgi:hypothetical protein
VAHDTCRDTLGLLAAGVAIPLFVLLHERQKAYRDSDVGRARMEQVKRYVPRLELEASLEAFLVKLRDRRLPGRVRHARRGQVDARGARAEQERRGDRCGEDGRCVGCRAQIAQHARRGHGALKQPRRLAQPKTYVPPKALKGELYDRLAQATQAYRAAHPDEPHWRPTVVFDIERQSSGELIASVCARAKQRAHDTGLCHVILVLSSSFAEAELPVDRGRQQFLRVGSFSREEASAVLDATLTTLPKEVASDAAVAAVKARVLPLITLAKLIRALEVELRGSTREADLRARAEAWASAF